MDPGCTRPDHVLHQLERVEHTAKAGFSVSHDGRKVVDIPRVARIDPLRMLDLVGAAEGVVDAFDHLRNRVNRVKRLVRVHRSRVIVVGGHLPTRQVNRLDARFDLLHGLSTGQCAQAIHIGLGVHQAPEFFCTAARQGVLNRERTTQTHHIGSAVTALDPLPAGIGGPVFFQCGDLLFAAQLFGQGLGHEITPWVN